MAKTKKEIIAWLRTEIQSMREHMDREHMDREELANDYYYTRGSYNTDKRYLESLEKELNDLLAMGENVIPFAPKQKYML